MPHPMEQKMIGVTPRKEDSIREQTRVADIIVDIKEKITDRRMNTKR